MIAALFLSLILLGYTYFGYPLLLRLLGRRRTDGPPPPLPEPLPRVSVIVTAHNEETAIERKIGNILELDYPSDRLELIIASDASTDRTDAIVTARADRRVRLSRLDRRGGKVAASRAAVAVATGSVLVFSDATGRLDPGGVKALVGRLSDPTVGAVSGLVLLDVPPGAASAEGQGSYWTYNNELLLAEGALASVTSLAGAYFAVRSDLYPHDIADDLAEDLIVALSVVLAGKRAVVEPRAVCREAAVSSDGQELRRRSRITLQNIRGLLWGRRLLNPFRHGRFALFLWSHKLMRILAPVLLAVTAVTNLALWSRHPVFAGGVVGQALFYLLGALAQPLRLRRFRLVNAIRFFCLSNLGVAIGIGRFVAGGRAATWEPERDDGRSGPPNLELHDPESAAHDERGESG